MQKLHLRCCSPQWCILAELHFELLLEFQVSVGTLRIYLVVRYELANQVASFQCNLKRNMHCVNGDCEGGGKARNITFLFFCLFTFGISLFVYCGFDGS